ncbi:CATRA system-associated protein [Actinoplanes sp. HUAS TT8]|uniref:CATRA system-associated protein n=1 Tax=Actinoplanes sp. HUAS TT8 TaxID=3447453 RepID=UPI003F52494C
MRREDTMNIEDRHDLADLLSGVPAWTHPPAAWDEIERVLGRLGAGLGGDGDPMAAWRELSRFAPARITEDPEDDPAESAPPTIHEVVTRLVRQIGEIPAEADESPA